MSMHDLINGYSGQQDETSKQTEREKTTIENLMDGYSKDRYSKQSIDEDQKEAQVPEADYNKLLEDQAKIKAELDQLKNDNK